ncbi:hypothetical protein LCGC14_1698500 [marine sediment metagenome]|uniref:Rhamnulokinase n=1 Tax=marine sediment metagenome TaxID=412755 RepID=A0A0F9HJ87_9ZZZZ
MNIIAIDLGASNGRVIVGKFDNEKNLELEIIFRFKNYGVSMKDSLYWDILHIFEKIKKGLRKCSEKYKDDRFVSLGLTTWGVDFVLLDECDELLSPVYHYRDSRTKGIPGKLFEIVPRKEIFNQTGIQFMQINTINQLYSMIEHKSPKLSIAKTFMMLPDFINFLLSGVKYCEYSVATTSQLYNPITRNWAFDLITKLGLNPDWFGEIIQPGTILGNIQEHIAKETGISNMTKVIVPPTHDTGSAVVAVPVDMDKYKLGEWAYLSSGTWSLLGVERAEPLINENVLQFNFTNEGGFNNTIRFLKNITGLWLIQECKRIWEKKGLRLSWDKIEQEALESQAFQNFFYPDDPSFLNPTDMIEEIKNYCEIHDQTPPQTVGQISRAIFENLAFRYRQVFDQLEILTGKKIKILFIIGGGSQNNLLNQFTANVLNIPVKAGPVEATAIGNILVQALALGEIKNIIDLRYVVKSSFKIKEYFPKDNENWDNAYKEYLTKINNSNGDKY